MYLVYKVNFDIYIYFKILNNVKLFTKLNTPILNLHIKFEIKRFLFFFFNVRIRGEKEISN
jgi:hypothetical protein